MSRTKLTALATVSLCFFVLSGCYNMTNFNTGRVLKRGEVQVGAGGYGTFYNDGAFGGGELASRFGLTQTGVADLGIKVMYFPLNVFGDAKFRLLDESTSFMSMALQVGTNVPMLMHDLMAALLFSRRFGRYEPYFACRFHYLTLFYGDEDSAIDESGVSNDLILGSRIRVYKDLHLVPEAGVVIPFSGGGVSFTGALALQWDF